MVILGSIVKVADKTGVVLAECITIVGHFNKKVATIGDFTVVTVRWINAKRMAQMKERWQHKYRLGSIHRGVMIRSNTNIQRDYGLFLRFEEQSMILVTKKGVPVTNRMFGPILRETCVRYPAIGCVARKII